jgi:hypothetical protein
VGRQAEQDAVPGALISSVKTERPALRGPFCIWDFTFLQAKKRGGITRPLFLPFFIILMNRILRKFLTDILTGLRLSVYAGVILPTSADAATEANPPSYHFPLLPTEINSFKNR